MTKSDFLYWLKKTIYNPFKPHIIYAEKWKCYGIRRWNWISGWEFMDVSSTKFFWWTEPQYVKKYCKIATLELAKTRLLEYNTWEEPQEYTRIVERD